MIARGWTRRPLAETERRPAFAAASLLLVGLALAALLTTPHHRAPTRQTLSTQPARPRPTAGPAASPVPDRAGVVRDAREFLSGYLAYLYEGADAQSIPHVSFALRRTLAHHPPRRRPRHGGRVRLLDVQILTVTAETADVVATVVDESGATFPIRLKQRRVAGVWEVSSLAR